MALGIYLNGTTGLADGTLEVPDDGSGITLGAVGSVATFHLRHPSGKVNAVQVVVNAPDSCEVSTDGVTYGATATYSAGAIGSTNVACYVKRVSGTTASTTGLVTTPRLANVTEQVAPAPPAAFTPTVVPSTTSAAVTFSTTDPNGDSLTYKVAVTQSATPPADWSGYSTATSPKTVTGLTAGTSGYYAHVQASDGTYTTVGTSATFATSADQHLFTNDFAAGQALDTANLTAVLAANGTANVGSNRLTIATTANSDGAYVTFDYPCDKTRATGNVYKAKYQHVSGDTYSMLGIASAQPTTFPTPLSHLGLNVNSGTNIQALYRNQAGTWNYYNWSSGTWSTSAASLAVTSVSVYIVHFETRMNSTTPEFRYVVCDSTDVAITNGTMAWTAFSNLKDDASNTYYPMIGDTSTGAYASSAYVYSVSKA